MSEPVYSEFSIGNIFSQGFSIIGKSLGTLVVCALIVFAVIAAASTALSLSTGFSIMAFMDDPLNNMEAAAAAGILVFVFVILYALIYFVFISIVIQSSSNAIHDQRSDISTLFTKGFSHIIPLFFLALLVGICISIGFVLLIIPGFIVMTMLYVTFPAKVVDNVGVFESLSRSAELTKGHRWSIFGLIVIPYIGYLILSMVIALTAFLPVLYFILTMAIGLLYSIFTLAISTAAYHSLINEKEGGSTEAVSEVFT